MVVLGALVSCQEPTQITVDVVGEVPFREGMAVAVQVARVGEAELAPTRSFTNAPWTYGSTIGTLVLGPGETSDAEVRVVLALGRAPETCSAQDPTGCVVYRRRVSFSRGESLDVKAVLRSACLGIYCDKGTSCRADRSCGPIDSDEPGSPAPTPREAVDPYGREVLSDRPRHYYRFDEPVGATVAHDELGRADGTYRDGVRLGATGALSVGSGTAAYFDGARARVLVPKVDELPGPMTLEAWVRSDSAEGEAKTLVERIDEDVKGQLLGYRLSAPSPESAKLELYRIEGRLEAQSTFGSDGFGFKHVVAVADGRRVRVYVDGKVDRETPYREGPASPTITPLVVAAGRGSFFRGAIDELAIYDYALDQAAVRRHLAASKPK